MNKQDTDARLDAHEWPTMPADVRSRLDTRIAGDSGSRLPRSLSFPRAALLAACVGIVGILVGYALRGTPQQGSTIHGAPIAGNTSTNTNANADPNSTAVARAAQDAPVVVRINAQPFASPALGAAAMRPSLTN